MAGGAVTDQELRAWLENLPLLARLAETGLAPFGPDAEQVRAELHALLRRAKGSGYDVAEKARDLLSERKRNMNPETGAIAKFESKEDAKAAGYTEELFWTTRSRT